MNPADRDSLKRTPAATMNDDYEKMILRSSSLIRIYVDALNRVKQGVHSVNLKLGNPTFYEGGQDFSHRQFEDAARRLLDKELSDKDFDARIALESKEVRGLLKEFNYTMEALQDLINNGYFELAEEFDPDHQKKLAQGRAKPWERFVPFMLAIKARQRVRRNLKRDKHTAALTMKSIFQRFFADRKKKGRKTNS